MKSENTKTLEALFEEQGNKPSYEIMRFFIESAMFGPTEEARKFALDTIKSKHPSYVGLYVKDKHLYASLRTDDGINVGSFYVMNVPRDYQNYPDEMLSIDFKANVH